MSLRVLLADESASIRKVFQMGLQDYGAEVKSVHNGLDVIEVAEKFKPDIIFADILLQKKNGYEVSKEVGENSQLSETPVVLMWSSFMELDQSQFKASGAKGELEKPFDVESMREMIQTLVGITQSQMISSFLKFPSSITSEFKEEGQAQAIDKKPPQSSSPEVTQPDLQLENDESDHQEEASVFNSQVADDEDDQDFDMYEVPSQITPLKHEEPSREEPFDEDIPESWEAKPLNNNQNLESDRNSVSESQEDEFQSMDLAKDKKLDLNEFLYKPDKPNPPPKVKSQSSPAIEVHNVQIPDYDDTFVSANAVNPEETEAIIRSETRAYLMNYVKKDFPKLLEKIVREELEKVVQQEMALKDTPTEP